MPTRTVDVLARFRADTKQMRGSMGGLVMTADALIAKAKWAGLALGAGLGYAAKKAVDLQSTMESARMGMATMLQNASKLPVTFDTALGEADDMIVKIRKDAALLPGTFDEMQQSFSTLLPVLAKAGSNLEQIRRVAGKSVVAARLGGGILGGAGTVARDIAQILGGSADDRTTQTNAFKGHVAELKQLAKLSQAKAVAEMERLLTVSDQALAAYANTWDAQWSTAVDKAKEFARLATKPLFGYAVKKLAELNSWMESNQEILSQMASEWGRDLLESIKSTVAFVKDDLWPPMKAIAFLAKELVEHWKTIAITIAGIKIADWVSKMTDGVGKLNPMILMMQAATLSFANAVDTWSTAMSEYRDLRDTEANIASMKTKDQYIRERFAKAYEDPAFRQLVKLQTARTRDSMDATARQQLATIGQMQTGSWRGEPPVTEHFKTMLKLTDAEFAKALDASTQAALLRQWKGMPRPPEAPFELKPGETKPPVIDARGSNFYLDLNIEDGDPDRIALELPHSLYSAFRPTLPGTAPAM